MMDLFAFSVEINAPSYIIPLEKIAILVVIPGMENMIVWMTDLQVLEDPSGWAQEVGVCNL